MSTKESASRGAIPTTSQRLNAQGHETLSSKPVSMPVGFKKPETLAEQVQRLVRTSVSQYAQNNDMDTFEEGEDFDIEDDDIDPYTPYEVLFDPILGKDVTPHDFHVNQAHYRQQYIARQQYEDSLQKTVASTGESEEVPPS